MRDQKVLNEIAIHRFGAPLRLYPLNPTLKTNPSNVATRAILARGAFLAN